MKKFVPVFFLMIQTCLGFSQSSVPSTSKLEISSLPLTSDFKNAKNLAKAYKLPLILVFTGSDWCPNSKKILSMFKNLEFQNQIQKSVIFVQVDFPEVSCADKSTIEANFALKEQYGIEEFPVLVVLSEDLDLITKVGVSEQESKELAIHLLKQIDEYGKLKDFLSLEKREQPLDLIQKGYLAAKELGCDALISSYMDIGMEREDGIFFHMEKYSAQLATGFQDESLKQEIIKKDKEGHHQAVIRLALCDFQELSRQYPEDPDRAIHPLMEYAEKHGLKGESSLWKVHKLIAKHLRTKGDFEKALVHAKLSLKEAPSEQQKEIKKLIKCFSNELIAQESPEVLKIESDYPSSLQ